MPNITRVLKLVILYFFYRSSDLGMITEHVNAKSRVFCLSSELSVIVIKTRRDRAKFKAVSTGQQLAWAQSNPLQATAFQLKCQPVLMRN